jgi:prepilin-type N-terminal cleavage/methylation domain-containing protein
MKKPVLFNKNGFSLTELMVTIALFTILCLMAIPQFLRFAENGNLRSATRDITSDIMNMRETALARGAQCRITFNTGANNYILTTPDGNMTKTPSNFSPDIVITNAGFFGGNPNSIAFQPRGTATNGTLTLRNARGSTATITVNITGKTYATFTMQ